MNPNIENRYKIYWNNVQNTPVIIDSFSNTISSRGNELSYMATDIRPVFNEEKFLLSLICPEECQNIFSQSVWADKSNNMFIDGKKLRISILKKADDIDIEFLRNAVIGFKPSDDAIKSEKLNIQNFVKLNAEHYSHIMYSRELDKEGLPVGAEPFIEATAKRYPQRTAFVSFSGGKDSTVVSHLVTKALNNPAIVHIFCDTTLEFLETYEYIEQFRKQYDYTPFLIEKNDSSGFMELCERVGPPSRVKSWCCSIFKTGPLGTTLSEMNLDLLTFYGVRRHESTSRSKYLRIAASPKLEKQIVASPVIDWLDIDIWLYLLTENLNFNEAYRKGFTRVGCWCCPNNSRWSDFLTSVYHVKQYNEWRDFLIKFAIKIGKPDADVYIKDGKWKARHGGEGLETGVTKVKSKVCTLENNSRTYNLYKPICNDLYELFKPFGLLDFSIGRKSLSEVYVVSRHGELLLKITGASNGKQLRIAILCDLNKAFKNNSINQNIFNYFERQIRKYQTCLYCKACNSVCPVSAIKVANEKYEINENKCIHCLKCIMHFDDGCLIASALATKSKD